MRIATVTWVVCSIVFMPSTAVAQQSTPTYEQFSSAKLTDPYGLQAGPNSAFSTSYGAGTIFNRPSRNGQSTMIGASSAQTESATAQSFAVTQPVSAAVTNRTQLPLSVSPAFRPASSFSGQMVGSPALSPSTVSLSQPSGQFSNGMPGVEQGIMRLEGRHGRRGAGLEKDLTNPLSGL
jgi:hypothetical protein